MNRRGMVNCITGSYFFNINEIDGRIPFNLG